jgi:hypothetical protein
MSSTIEKNKLRNSNQQSSNSDSILSKATATIGANQTLKKGQDKNNTREEEEGAKTTKKANQGRLKRYTKTYQTSYDRRAEQLRDSKYPSA